MEPKQQFAKNLRAIREEKGLSIEELGAAADVHFTQISRYERGLREPRLNAIAKLAHGLGVPVARLLEGVVYPSS